MGSAVLHGERQGGSTSGSTTATAHAAQQRTAQKRTEQPIAQRHSRATGKHTPRQRPRGSVGAVHTEIGTPAHGRVSASWTGLPLHLKCGESHAHSLEGAQKSGLALTCGQTVAHLSLDELPVSAQCAAEPGHVRPTVASSTDAFVHEHGLVS